MTERNQITRAAIHFSALELRACQRMLNDDLEHMFVRPQTLQYYSDILADIRSDENDENGHVDWDLVHTVVEDVLARNLESIDSEITETNEKIFDITL